MQDYDLIYICMVFVWGIWEMSDFVWDLYIIYEQNNYFHY